MFVRVPVFVAALTVCASVGFAQLPTGAVSGLVRDASGGSIPGVTISAHNRETGSTRTTQSDAEGRFRLPALAVGMYDVKAELQGFQTQLQEGLRLEVGQDAVLRFTLEVQTLQETVTVTAGTPLVQTTSGALGGVVSEQRIADLPLNGRNFNQLVFLQPGISAFRTNSSTSTLAAPMIYSSQGAPIRSNAILLDGTSMVGPSGVSGVSVTGSMLGVEGIREFRVLTNSFPAEYGMSMGSQMTVVSKSGTNEYHGSVFEYLRNSALDARNFFDRTTADGSRIPPFRRNNFGGALGGPIRADKMFFFGTYEGLREHLGLTQVLNVPTADARRDGFLVPRIADAVKPYLNLYPLPTEPLPTDPAGATGVGRYTYVFPRETREDFGQGRWDYYISEKAFLFARYTIQDVERVAPATFAEFLDASRSRGQYLTLAENHSVSPTLLNVTRLSYSRSYQRFESPSDPALGFYPGLEMGRIVPGSGVSIIGPVGTRPSVSGLEVYTLSSDVSWSRGSHLWKFGTLMNRYDLYLLSASDSRGQWTFSDLRQFLLGSALQFTIRHPSSVLDRAYLWNTFGFYAQDDWRAASRLTVNLGLRYEFNTTVNETTGHGSSLRDIANDSTPTLEPPLFENPSLENFSPRLGIAWDIFGDGRMALRAGFGLLYDVSGFMTAAQISTRNPPYSSQNTLRTNLTFPVTALPPGQLGTTLGLVDYYMQQPHLLQYNLTLERQLPHAMVVSASYAGSRGDNLYRWIEGNPTFPSTVVDGRRFWTGDEPRRNPNWSNIDLITATAKSWYDSLQLEVRKQLTGGLQFQSSYTWAKAIDTTQGQQPGEHGGSGRAVDPLDPKTDQGPADFDTRHSWTVNALYRLPSPAMRGLGRILDGWQLGSIFSVRTGLPFSVMLSGNRSRTESGGNNPDRPDLVPGLTPDDIILGGADRYFDPTAFAIQPAGFLGTSSKNFLEGPTMVNLDFSLTKSTRMPWVGDNGRLEFRAEIFNALNHANFNIPNDGRTVFTADATRANPQPLPTAGQIDRTTTPSRQIQLALRLVF